MNLEILEKFFEKILKNVGKFDINVIKCENINIKFY